MGFGSYSHEAHELLIARRGSADGAVKPGAQPVFAQRSIHPLMAPNGVRVREARDSADHPSSIGIAFALDVTGSMADIPELLARKHLPKFMKVLGDCNVPDPQLLFLALGDATSDSAPLQVGQFESTAERMDEWLTRTWLERKGGPGIHESYELALYFLAQHTEMDCYVKRKKRGYVFMTGDELPYDVLPKSIVDTVVGDRLDEDLKVEEIVAKLQESYVPFFLIPDAARAKRCEARWRELLGDHVLVMNRPDDVCFVAAGALLVTEGLVRSTDGLVHVLSGAGLPDDRRGPVMRTLRVLAEKHGIEESSTLRKWLGALVE